MYNLNKTLIFSLFVLSCGKQETTSEIAAVTPEGVIVTVKPNAINREIPTKSWTDNTKKGSKNGAYFIANWFSRPIKSHKDENGMLLSEPIIVDWHTGYNNYPNVDKTIPNYKSKCTFETPEFITGNKPARLYISLDINAENAKFVVDIFHSNKVQKTKSFDWNKRDKYIEEILIPKDIKDLKVRICKLEFADVSNYRDESSITGSYKFEVVKAHIDQINL